ncbi:GNAT family N-acetyltransferase [Streptococcus panodentis]|uniref:GNAT family N-acetyltransferase n=1 Tax=Streptococcus panodentis TaxID=1581472 RepID=A0ABS5AYZ0_9STRE|nr:GNAT family N-acetyltransferase [Streptococcus panodentis]MBP2621792.1 GNAT family N-acetyltransferase [Streptococcus panodentis]
MGVKRFGEPFQPELRNKREPSDSQALDIYLEDEEGNLIAGMAAETFGNWLEIEYLYVQEGLRRQGIGSKIFNLAEKEARLRKCKYSFVDTYQFQAPSFYKKHGYNDSHSMHELQFLTKQRNIVRYRLKLLCPNK